MGAAISMVNYVLHKFREKEIEIGAKSLMNYAIDKSKELLTAVGNIGGNLMGNTADKWKELPLVLGELGGKVVDKCKELPVVIGNMGGNLMTSKVDKAILQHLIQVIKPYVISTAAAVALIILLYYFPRCGGAAGKLVIKMTKGISNCFRRSAASGSETSCEDDESSLEEFMMIPRHVFESNPRTYFRGLRGKSL
ncbi:hypothetical protein ACSBR1_006457 [Camellia fascicularis]